ncbi:DMT family transporter [uncultured Megasphaera sp.]|uniref:DMT family transporter n=1 Tax=uncultured Megasphaera sp. TaxID=165188 RepID=UPI002658DB42|nr:EamA family transporter [uncultured Megasphaera sp.]
MMILRMNRKTAAACIIAAGVCWGIIGLFSRYLAAHGLSPVQITFSRSLVTALAMTAGMLWRRPRGLCVAWRDMWMFLGTGLCSIVFFNVCYFTAMELTTLSMAAILLYTAPSIVMALSVLLFHEKFTPMKALCLVLSFLGCVLVSGLGIGHINIPGILAGLGAGLGYALYSVFGHYALAKYSPFTVTTWTFIIASLGLAGFSDVPAMAASMASSPVMFIMAVLLGLLSTTIPFILYTVGLSAMETGKAAILASVEPLTATVISIAVFHESLSITGAIGIFCIVCAIVLLNKKS